MVTPDPHREGGSFKERFYKKFDELKSQENFGNVYKYASANTRDTISYVLLIVGLVLLFFHPFYGGLLIGLIFGLYFANELLAFLHNINEFVDDQGIVRSLILGGLVLGFLICAPSIFIGAVIAVTIRQLLFPENRRP